MTARSHDPITAWHPGAPWKEVATGFFIGPPDTPPPPARLVLDPPRRPAGTLADELATIRAVEDAMRPEGPALTPATQAKVASAIDKAVDGLELALAYLETQGVTVTAGRLREVLVALANVCAVDDQLLPPAPRHE